MLDVTLSRGDVTLPEGGTYGPGQQLPSSSPRASTSGLTAAGAVGAVGAPGGGGGGTVVLPEETVRAMQQQLRDYELRQRELLATIAAMTESYQRTITDLQV